MLLKKQESLALASMARDDPPASSTASSTAPASRTAAAMRGKVGSEFETRISYNAPLHFVTDRRTDGQKDGHWRHSKSMRCIYYISIALIKRLVFTLLGLRCAFLACRVKKNCNSDLTTLNGDYFCTLCRSLVSFRPVIYESINESA